VKWSLMIHLDRGQMGGSQGKQEVIKRKNKKTVGTLTHMCLHGHSHVIIGTPQWDSKHDSLCSEKMLKTIYSQSVKSMEALSELVFLCHALLWCIRSNSALSTEFYTVQLCVH